MVETLEVEGHNRGRGRFKKCLVKTLYNDMFVFGLSNPLAFDKTTWEGKIHVVQIVGINSGYCCCC